MNKSANKIVFFFLLIIFLISSILTASSWATDPVPDIKANGSDGPVTVSFGDPFTLTGQLNVGSMSGQNADWWVGVNIASSPPDDWYHYDLTLGWMPGKTPTYQGPLFDLNPYDVLGMPGLPVGAYAFYLAVDTAMNGLLDLDKIYYDSVQVNITQSDPTTGSVKVQNKYTSSITKLFISLSSAYIWGDNQISSDISPGSSRTVDDFTPDTYDLRVDFSDGTTAYSWEFAVVAGDTTTITFN